MLNLGFRLLPTPLAAAQEAVESPIAGDGALHGLLRSSEGCGEEAKAQVEHVFDGAPAVLQPSVMRTLVMAPKP